MDWTKLAGDCHGDDDCPNIRETPRGTIAVQGPLMTHVYPPDGEAVVEISANMLMEAARVLATR